ncbi:hypothetical protein Tco_1550756 [Tanacetum coccineum]
MEEALTRALIVKQGTHPSMIRVPVTIKILVMTNLHIILRVSHDSLTVVRPVEYHIDQSPPLDPYFQNKNLDDFKMQIMESTESILRSLRSDPPVSLVDTEEVDDVSEVIGDEDQFLRQHNTAHVTPPPLAYTPPPPFLATMEPLDTFLMGDDIISTIPTREIDEFIKSSVEDLAPILKESEVTLVSIVLECSMLIDSPSLPCTDVLTDAILDINLPFGEHLDTLSTGDREIDFNPSRDIKELERLLANNPIPIPKVFDEPLGNSDLMSRSSETSDLFEELIAEIGLDDSIYRSVVTYKVLLTCSTTS